MKTLLSTVFLLAVIVFSAYYIYDKNTVRKIHMKTTDRIQVMTTLFPLYDFVKSIGGEKVEVKLLLPPGIEAHEFEPKAGDIVNIDKSDLFIFMGNGMEPWVDKITGNFTGKKITVVNASSGCALTDIETEENKKVKDPHLWLDFSNDIVIGENIKNALIKIDPVNSGVYDDNFKSFKDKIIKMDEKFKKGLKSCQKDIFVIGGHNAFGYLAKRYGLKYVAAEGVVPESEPSAKDIAEITSLMNNMGIKHIFYEELLQPTIAETISKDTGSQMLLLSAAHNVSKDDISAGKTFNDIMEQNLINLRKGLQCQ